MRKKQAVVITSISAPNKAMKALAEGASSRNVEFIVVGDVASPRDFELSGCRFVDLAGQLSSGFSFARICPTRHYSRKNVGYLLAFQAGADIVIDTDDDNFPKSAFWDEREPSAESKTITRLGWCNVYKYFTDSNVWPRGLPLNQIKVAPQPFEELPATSIVCPIEQGLADNNPDVDAIFRLAFDLPFDFAHPDRQVALGPGAWCPFNSQNTRWHRSVFPLMYLPSFCSFRMTDIWRSFIAQRICSQNGWGILFHGATVWQERNEHDLMKDFADEVPGYTQNQSIMELLENVRLEAGVKHIHRNLRLCYEALTDAGCISQDELGLLDAWLQDLSSLP